MLTTVTSATLLQGLEAQNEDAWRRFDERYSPVLLSVARHAGLQGDDAQDVVQDTLAAFLDAFQQGKYDPARGRLRSFLLGIISNKIKEAHRRLARRGIQPSDRSDATGFIERIPDDRELTRVFDEERERRIMAEGLKVARDRFDATTYRAFELYALKGWPVDRVAEHMDVSRNAVYISKSRILSFLREYVKDMTDSW